MEFVKKREEVEGRIEIWLGEGASNGAVEIRGRDSKGYSKIIAILKAGKLRLCTSAQLNGLETDPEGRIMLDIE